MAKVFVSYSRKDIDFAKKLASELEKNSIDFWVDWEGIPPTVDWWKQIEKGIEEADIFLFLISPDSAKSKICAQEIDTAVKNGKRLIPLVVRDVKGEDAPQQLGHINWIFFRESDDFASAFNKLLNGIQTDYEWAQTHRRLQVKALEWERSQKESSFLLRGKDLQDAESQLAVNTSKEPHPTDLQREYVLKSRQAADRQRRITTGISVAGIIALAALAVFGFVQAGRATISANEAIKQASAARTAEANAETAQKIAEAESRAANSGRLALESQSNLTSFPQRGLLLALEAAYINKKANEPIEADTEEALRQALEQVPGIGLPGFKHQVDLVQFTKDDKWLVAGATLSEGEIKIWNFGKLLSDPTYQPFYISLPVSTSNDSFTSNVYLSPQTTWLVFDQEKTLLWEIDTTNEARTAIEFQGNIEFPDKNDDHIILEKQKEKVVVWKFDSETSAKNELKSFQGTYVVRSQDSKYLVTDDSQKGLLLWDFNSPTKPPILLTSKHASDYAAFYTDPKNRWLILFENAPHEEIQVPTYDPITSAQTGTKPWDSTDIVLIPLGQKKTQEYKISLDIAVDLESTKPMFSPEGNAMLYTGSSSPNSLGQVLYQTYGILKFKNQEFINSIAPLQDNYLYVTQFVNENWVYTQADSSNSGSYFIYQFTDLRDEDLLPDVTTPVRPWTDNNGKLQFSSDGKSILTTDGNQIDFDQLDINRAIILNPTLTTPTGGIENNLEYVLNNTPKQTGLEDTASVSTLSADKNWLVAGARDGSLRLWNNNSWKNSSMSLSINTDYISFSNDGQWMAINNQLWRLKDGKPDISFALEETSEVYGMAVFSPDSHWLIYVEHFWYSDDQTKLPQIKLVNLAKSTKDGKVNSTTIYTGTENSTFEKILFSANSQWVTIDDTQAFSGENSGNLFTYNIEKKNGYIVDIPTYGFSYTQDQQHMVLIQLNYYSGTKVNPIILALPTQDNNKPEKIGEIESPDISIISKDGRWLLAIPQTKAQVVAQSKLWDINCVIAQKECAPFKLSANNGGFSPDSKYLLTGDLEGYTTDNLLNFDVWNLQVDQATNIRKAYSSQTTESFPSISNDGSEIIFSSRYQSRISPAGLFSGWGGYDSIGINLTTYDGYGRLVLGGGGGGGGDIGSFQKDYSVDVFTLADNIKSPQSGPIVFHGHESNVSTSQISPNGKLVLTYSGAPRDGGGNAENILRLWSIDKMRSDPTTKGIILPIDLGNQGEKYITNLAFSPDSRWVYVIDSTNTLYYFPVSVDELEKQACIAVGRNLTISEWQRYFPGQEYRKTCENLPVHPSVEASQ
ncbi:MAG: TIR domain-containing protein [Anaerolineales bacterium]